MRYRRRAPNRKRSLFRQRTIIAIRKRRWRVPTNAIAVRFRIWPERRTEHFGGPNTESFSPKVRSSIIHVTGNACGADRCQQNDTRYDRVRAHAWRFVVYVGVLMDRTAKRYPLIHFSREKYTVEKTRDINLRRTKRRRSKTRPHSRRAFPHSRQNTFYNVTPSYGTRVACKTF